MMMAAVRKSTNWFAIGITAAVVVVVLIVGGWSGSPTARRPRPGRFRSPPR